MMKMDMDIHDLFKLLDGIVPPKNEDGSKKIILAIDDEPTNLTRINHILKPYFDVRVCSVGKQALFMLMQFKPDLILLDIEMPGMTGFDFMEQCRERFPGWDVPVIFVTSHKNQNSVALASQEGAVGYIGKPFVPQTLLSKVCTVLRE
ncbi:MAG: response regulator [Synergistaceae bacterium]|jgi:putative two-component system response regulator|nr:response regulator [Synergistaceae bacterium]